MKRVLIATVLSFIITSLTIILINYLPEQVEQTANKNIETLILEGSNTVGESLAPLLAEKFLRSIGAVLIKRNQLENPVEKSIEGIIPNTDKVIRINIKAHGSSTGFKAISADSSQIAMSSREIKPKEFSTLVNKYGLVNEIPIALDALAIITYPENPLEQLTIKQTAQIFSGEVNNWLQVGGEDKPIKLFSRDNNSGTWDTFKNLVLKKFDKELSTSSMRLESSQKLANYVVNTSGSAGFVGVAHSSGTKLLRIAEQANITGEKPTAFTIGTQNYPLSRNLYFYTSGTKLSNLAHSFINFTSRDTGQKLASKSGLVSYYPTRNRPDFITLQTPEKYRKLVATGNRITVDFSYDPQKADRAKEQRDIVRLENYMKQNKGKKIILVDFSYSPRLSALKLLLQRSNIQVLDTMNIEYDQRRGKNIEVWVL